MTVLLRILPGLCRSAAFERVGPGGPAGTWGHGMLAKLQVPSGGRDLHSVEALSIRLLQAASVQVPGVTRFPS